MIAAIVVAGVAVAGLGWFFYNEGVRSGSEEVAPVLRADSDVIDRGLHIPGINDDYAGAGPDTGAFEYRGHNLRRGTALPLPPPVASVTLPYEDPLYKLPPSDPASPPDNSSPLYYQVDGYNRIALIPGADPMRDIRLEALP